MTDKLKPCPFCGGKGGYSLGVVVKCTKCGSTTSVQETGKEAADAWNSSQIKEKFYEKIGKLEAEKARLREALKKIIDRAEREESKASNATCGFEYDAECIARDALKGGAE